MWKYDRPCSDIGGITVFQEADVLKEIYDREGPSRYFERETSEGDVVGGRKLGVTRKYHFSIKEVRPFWELLPEIFKLANIHGVGQTTCKAMIATKSSNLPGNQNQTFVESGHSVPLCPECGGAMVERKSARGAFYGCRSFPNCRGTRSKTQSE